MASFAHMDQGNSHDLLPNLVIAENRKRSRKVKYNYEIFKNVAIHDLLDSYGVTNHNNRMKYVKSPTQCKKRIEKHRSEAAASYSNSRSCSDWPSLCKAGIPGGMDAGCQSGVNEGDWQNDSKEVTEVKNADFFSDQSPVGKLGQSLHILQQYFDREQNFHIQRDLVTGQDDRGSGGAAVPESDTIPCPVIKIDETENNTSKAKLHKLIQHDVAMNIRSFADSILKLEQAKMEMYQDTERLRTEAETRQAEFQLKRTQIIMDTQLQIARLLSSKNHRGRTNNVSQSPRARLLSSKNHRGRTNNVSQSPRQNSVVIDKKCISRVQVDGQPDVQSVSPESMYLLSEPFLREE